MFGRSGYTLLHCAAAWGRLETLKALVELDADIEARNYLEESARDVAARYSQTECVEFLEWAGKGTSLWAGRVCVPHGLEAHGAPRWGTSTRYASGLSAPQTAGPAAGSFHACCAP